PSWPRVPCRAMTGSNKHWSVGSSRPLRPPFSPRSSSSFSAAAQLPPASVLRRRTGTPTPDLTMTPSLPWAPPHSTTTSRTDAMATRMQRVLSAVMLIGLVTGCARVTSTHSFSDHNTITQDTVVAFTPQAADAIGIDLADITAASITESTAGVMPGVDPSKVTIEDFVDG